MGKRSFVLLWLVVSALVAVGCSSATPTPLMFPEAEFGAVVMSGAVDAQNAPTEPKDAFSREEPIIYAVFEVRRLDAGTTLHVRWTSEEAEFEEESTPLISEQPYENVYIEFHLEPVQGETLEALPPGEYKVQLFVNGQPGPSTSFAIYS